MKTARFIALGFDLTKNVLFTSKFTVKCSQCSAMIINGIPCHESGCPNEKHECRGCNSLVAKNVRYCQDCQ